MTLSRFILSFGTLALALASAASSYRVTFLKPAMIANTELQPGDYKLEVDGEKAIIKSGKTSVEVAVRVETGNEKFSDTTVRYSNGDGKYHVQEIRLGGSKTKLVFLP